MTLTADGCTTVATPEQTGCCPPPLCGHDLCGMFCAFINILPSGPMWDYCKQKATQYFTSNEFDPDTCVPTVDPEFPSLVQHAIYTVLKLRDVVHNALYPALRESDPTTAETTVDSWLSRLQWEDCYNQHCRSVIGVELSPYEIMSECGPVFCDPEFPPELACAIKRGTLLALTRAQMGVIKNICGINWIIEPLGAKIQPHNLEDAIYDPPSGSLCPDKVEFEIVPLGDFIPGCIDTTVCSDHPVRPMIQAYQERNWCDTPAGLPSTVWPGVLVAECIVRSLMPSTCPNNIYRVC